MKSKDYRSFINAQLLGYVYYKRDNKIERRYIKESKIVGNILFILLENGSYINFTNKCKEFLPKLGNGLYLINAKKLGFYFNPNDVKHFHIEDEKLLSKKTNYINGYTYTLKPVSTTKYKCHIEYKKDDNFNNITFYTERVEEEAVKCTIASLLNVNANSINMKYFTPYKEKEDVNISLLEHLKTIKND